MNCPNCKNKKGQSVQVHPISHKCQKCGIRVFVDHTGKTIVHGSRKPASTPSKD